VTLQQSAANNLWPANNHGSPWPENSPQSIMASKTFTKAIGILSKPLLEIGPEKRNRREDEK